MNEIRVLSKQVANQIAAGEVVERPASVVKELVENAIDAGARRVRVEIQGGGTSLLRVVDDGWGIPSDQVPLAFAPHATSKIREAHDLFAISTMGFRGEALSSIASVAKIEMLTRTNQSDEGFTYTIHGGQRVDSGPCGTPVGTSITVRDLFFNTPARREYLRSAVAEAAAVTEVMMAQALAHPQVGFQYIVDGRSKLQTPGNGQSLDVIAALFGRGLIDSLTPIVGEKSGMQLSGWISHPTMHRGRRDQQYLFVNHRPILSRSVQAAVDRAYTGLLPHRRFPIFFLGLVVDPQLVDVNVHPTKAEVRFREDQVVFSLVNQAVKSGLDRGIAPAQIATGLKDETAWTMPFRSNPEPRVELPDQPKAQMPPQQVEWIPKQPTLFVRETAPGPSGVEDLLPLRVLAHLPPTYILAQSPRGLALIDQHIAHERVLYEAFAQKKVESQELLIPQTLSLTPAQAAASAMTLDVWQELGFEIEPFGGETLLLRSIPNCLGLEEARQAIMELLAGVGELGLSRDSAHQLAQEERERLWTRLSCHGAIKSGAKMSMLEMEELVRNWLATSRPALCPHGRPIVTLISHDELLRRFGRK